MSITASQMLLGPYHTRFHSLGYDLLQEFVPQLAKVVDETPAASSLAKQQIDQLQTFHRMLFISKSI